MGQDSELLRRFVEECSESAFEDFVRRNVNLVYSAALRLLSGDVHRAQDITQQVFAEAARQAKHLMKHPAPVGWLYTTTRRMALRLIRTEHRRKAREREAIMMNEVGNDPKPEWESLSPMLEDAMHQLGERDRLAILTRFFQQKDLREVGLALGLNENAARMRVERALEKLRAHLARKGLPSSAALLSSTLASHAVAAAPPAFVTTVATVSLAASAATSTSLTILEIMTMSKIKISIVGALLVTGVATPLVIHQQSEIRFQKQEKTLQEQEEQLAKLSAENERLAGLVAQTKNSPMPRLPAPRLKTTSQSDPGGNDFSATNLYSRLQGEQPKLPNEKLESYVEANHRNASSLLAAYRTTGGAAWLEEAMQKYPNDPQVAFEAAFKKGVPPEERRHWLDAFKGSAPDNSLASYLSALDYLKAGQSDQGIQELIAASGKKQFDDYTLDRVQDDEEAYRAAGFSVAEAKMIPSGQLLLPQLVELRDLSRNLLDLATSYRQSGDEASAQAAMQMAVNLGQRYLTGPAGQTEISKLVGLAIERNALSTMDPNSSFGSDSQTVKDRLDEIAQYRASLKELNTRAEPLFPALSEQDWISYKDRWRVFGEEAALRWVVNKYGQN